MKCAQEGCNNEATHSRTTNGFISDLGNWCDEHIKQFIPDHKKKDYPNLFKGGSDQINTIVGMPLSDDKPDYLKISEDKPTREGWYIYENDNGKILIEVFPEKFENCGRWKYELAVILNSKLQTINDIKGKWGREPIPLDE